MFVFFLLGMWLFITTRRQALFEKMAGLCIESFVAQVMTILLTNQRTAVFLAPPLKSPVSVLGTSAEGY